METGKVNEKVVPRERRQPATAEQVSEMEKREKKARQDPVRKEMQRWLLP